MKPANPANIANDSKAVEYKNVGFWSWTTTLYLDQLLQSASGGKTHQLWTKVRYIPEEILSKQRYYRHLCFLPYWICKSHPIEIAEFFLMLKPYQHSDVIEQLYSSDDNMASYPGVIEVAKRLYIDKDGQKYRRNVVGRKTAGSAWRLAKVVCKQWELNYDLQTLSADQVWDLLPKEFNGWKRLVHSSD